MTRQRSKHKDTSPDYVYLIRTDIAKWTSHVGLACDISNMLLFPGVYGSDGFGSVAGWGWVL